MATKDIFFYGGIDTDTESRFLPEGDYRDALYARGGEAGTANALSLESMRGGLLVANEQLTDDDTVIGSCPYVEQNAIIYFVRSNVGEHSIWQYNVLSQTHELVIQNEFLNFQPSRFIVHANIVNNVLYWTDGYFLNYEENNDGLWGYNPPRMLNILKAKDGAYSDVTNEFFDVIKAPMPFSPSIETLSEGTSNLIYGTIRQFAVQYVYENGERTVFSPLSKVMLPQNWNFVQGRNFLEPNLDNAVRIEVPTGSELIKIIRVAERDGNSGDFEIFYEVNKELSNISDNVTIDVPFDGSVSGNIIPLAEGIRNFDRVPQVAGCLEYLTGANQLCYVDIVEGYDGVLIGSSSANYIITEINYENARANNVRVAHTPNLSSPLTLENTQTADFGWCVGDKVIFTFTNNTTDSPITFVYEVTAAFLESIALASTANKFIAIINSMGQFLVNSLNANGYTVTGTPIVAPAGTYSINFTTTPYIKTFAQTTLLPYIASKPIKSLKTGVIHEFGIQYYDRAMRSGGVLGSDVFRVPVLFPTQESTGNFANEDSPYFVRPTFNLKHSPPVWARYYQMVWKRTRIADFQWRTGINIESLPTNNLYKISLDSYYETQYGASINHTINVGDIVRIVRTKGADVQAGVTGLAQYALSYIEAEVQRYEEGGGVSGSEAVYVTLFDKGAVLDSDDSFVLEIYSPRADNLVEPYYEIGEVYEVKNAYKETRHHGGQTVIGDVITPASAGSNIFVVEGDLRGYEGIDFPMTFSLGATVFNTSLSAVTSYNYRLNQSVIEVTDLSNGTAYDTYQLISELTDGETKLVLDFGDVYVRPRLTNRIDLGLATTLWRYWVEDPHQSDYFVSNVIDIGKIALIDILGGRKELKASGIHGGAFRDNVNENNLCSFDFNPTNKFDLDEQYGRVNRIIMSGYTLKVLQDRKETSVYIQRTMAVNGAGELSYTNQTFGGINPYDTLFGTIHPTSVKLVDGQLFYYDYHSGKLIRSLTNGQQALSVDKKVNTYFTNITNIIRSEGIENVLVQSAYDLLNTEYQIFFVYQQDGDVYDGIVFNYAQDRFKTRLTHFPSWTESLANVSIQWLRKDLYVMNEGDNLDFFGEPRLFEVQFYFNDAPTVMKRPLSLGLKAYPLVNEVAAFVDANNSYTSMLTTMDADIFKVYENGQWCEYRRDENDPSLPSYSIARRNLEGRPLRGYVIGHVIRYGGETKFVLSSAVVTYVGSDAIK